MCERWNDRNRYEGDYDRYADQGRDRWNNGDSHYGPGQEENRQNTRSQGRRYQQSDLAGPEYETGWEGYDQPRGRDYNRGGGIENDHTRFGRSGGYQNTGRYADENGAGRFAGSEGFGYGSQGRGYGRQEERGEGTGNPQGGYGEQPTYRNQNGGQNSGNWNNQRSELQSNAWQDSGPQWGYGGGAHMQGSHSRFGGGGGEGYAAQNSPMGTQQQTGSNYGGGGYGTGGQQHYGGGEGQNYGMGGQNPENDYGGYGPYAPGGYGTSTARGGGYNPTPGFQQYNRYSGGESWGSTGTLAGREEGPYNGRGPKGYHRSDDRIKEDVCEALTSNSFIDPSDVEISVEGGEVKLSGTVESRRAKRMIEDSLDSVPGVQDIQNNLKVSSRNGNSNMSSNNSGNSGSSKSGSGTNAKSSGK